jgi:prevent-host-death family protein
MITVNVKELKTRLSRYLRLAEEGKVVLVTRRGKVVAEVRPASRGPRGKRSLEAVMTSLAEQGLVDLPSRSGPVGLTPGIRVRDPAAALRVLDQLIAERKLR